MLFLLVFTFLIFPDNLKATSNSFNQNSVFNQNSSFLEFNDSDRGGGLQTLVIGTTLGYFSKRLYETGFFLSLGLVPREIKSLSPLAYKDEYSKLEFQEYENHCFIELFNEGDKPSDSYFISKYSESCLEKKNYKIDKQESLLVEKYY